MSVPMLADETPAAFVRTIVAVPPATVTLYVMPFVVVDPVAKFVNAMIDPSTFTLFG